MKSIHRATLDTCASASGLVVAIDVLRAFTTAAFLFAAGVEEIALVGTVEQAQALRQADPPVLLVGEIDGIPIQGFDFGNSPSAFLDLDLRGRRVVQRTTAGTQGVVRSVKAGEILLGSLVVASATLRHIQRSAWEQITLVQTGVLPGGWGDEDAACADLLADGLSGRTSDLDGIRRRVRESRSGAHYDGTRQAFPPSDLELAQQVDRFDFAMQVERRGDLLVARKVL